MSDIKLRWYQQGAHDAFVNYLDTTNKNPLIVLPCGAGKSYTISSIIKTMIDETPDLRVGMVTHQAQLIEQNYRSLLNTWNTNKAGIYSAGLGRRNTKAQILFMGVQSVYNKLDEIGGFDVVIVDECQLIPKNAETRYGKFFEANEKLIPWARVGGFTATPYRLDTGLIYGPDAPIFDEITYEAPVRKLIDQGYLSELITKKTETLLRTDGVRKSGGDYVQKALQEAVDVDYLTRAAVDEFVEMGADRSTWLIFAVGVEHASHIRDILAEKGIDCGIITGDTSQVERSRTINGLKNRSLRACVNVSVMTVGTDIPNIDMLVDMRPTASLGLFQQIIGRGLRVSDGKRNCLVASFTKNIQTHGPIDEPFIPTPKEKREGAEAPLKGCPDCEAIVSIQTRVCPECSFEFPFEEAPPDINTHASSDAILKPKSDTSWSGVDQLSYQLWSKPGRPVTLRVTYHPVSQPVVSEWHSFEGVNEWAKNRLAEWWSVVMGPGHIVPDTAKEALQRVHLFEHPGSIAVQKNGRYSNVVGHLHTGRTPAAYKVCDTCYTNMPAEELMCSRCKIPFGTGVSAENGTGIVARINLETLGDFDEVPF